MREQVAAARRMAEELREAPRPRSPRSDAEARLDRVHALAVSLDLTLERADGSTYRRGRCVDRGGYGNQATQ